MGNIYYESIRIVCNDEVYIYYTASDLAMKANLPGHPQYEQLGKQTNGHRSGHAIGLAKMRLDGFASMDGYDPGGTMTTRPLVFEGDRLLVNARAPESAFSANGVSEKPHGRLKVEVLDAASCKPLRGLGEPECESFSGDELHHQVSWSGGARLADLQGVPIRLRFHLRSAALYAFQFVSGRSQISVVNRLSPGARGSS